MRVRVQKWGNSLGLRIPKAFAREIRVEADTPVELAVVDGSLMVTRIVEPVPTLTQLLEGVTEANRHGEVRTGPPVGKEVW